MGVENHTYTRIQTFKHAHTILKKNQLHPLKACCGYAPDLKSTLIIQVSLIVKVFSGHIQYNSRTIKEQAQPTLSIPMFIIHMLYMLYTLCIHIKIYPPPTVFMLVPFYKHRPHLLQISPTINDKCEKQISDSLQRRKNDEHTSTNIIFSSARKAALVGSSETIVCIA